MKIRTASTHRAINRWKSRASSETSRFVLAVLVLSAGAITSTRRRRVLLALPLIIGLSLNFAALEFAALVLIGFFVAKLQCYRLINSLARSFPPRA